MLGGYDEAGSTLRIESSVFWDKWENITMTLTSETLSSDSESLHPLILKQLTCIFAYVK